jgi:hypothetical protein
MTRVFGRGTWVPALLFATLTACPPGGGETLTDASTSGTGSTATSPTSTAASMTDPATTGGAEPTRCESHCESDSDCTLNGQDQGFRCIEGLCVYPACTSDAQCVADLSGWKTPCTDQAGCAGGEACVDVDGAGLCALEPGMFACADFGLVELMRPTIEGDATATVCGQAAVSCDDGECFAPCAGEASCPPQLGHPFCNEVSGLCECQIDQDCLDSQLAGFVLCVDGRCACGSDADCAGGQNVDTCFAGACGCSSDATCTAMVFDGAAMMCQ